MSSGLLSRSRGFFVVLEGLDGAGKTTIAKMLVEDLEKQGYKVLYTYEPTDSDIVSIVKTKYKELRDPYVDALTFALDRLLHIKLKIKPALEEGCVVISDRYYYSSVAYQSAGGAPLEWVVEVNKYALQPDVAIYLDVPPEIAIERKRGAKSRFPEFEELSFLFKVRNVYLKLVEQGFLIKVDATRNLEEVYRTVKEIVEHKLRAKLLRLY